jgi:hypothetical protein
VAIANLAENTIAYIPRSLLRPAPKMGAHGFSHKSSGTYLYVHTILAAEHGMHRAEVSTAVKVGASPKRWRTVMDTHTAFMKGKAVNLEKVSLD